MHLTRAALLALDADQITELLQCVIGDENDLIIGVLAGFDESCDIPDEHIPDHIKDAFIV
jgi:hypothetical protein